MSIFRSPEMLGFLLGLCGFIIVLLAPTFSALAVAAAVGASTAFMLPAAPPPNALVYATGHVTVREW